MARKFDKYKLTFYLNCILISAFTVWFLLIPYGNEYVNHIPIEINESEILSVNLDTLYSLNNKSNTKRKRDADLAILGKYSFQNETSNYTVIDESNLSKVWNSGHYILKKGMFDTNTHAFQAHSLFILTDLLYSYSLQNDKKYLKAGLRVFNNWYDNNPRYNLLASHYSWGDHTTALRLMNVVSLFSYLQGEEFKYDRASWNKYKEFVSEHISFLLSDNNYSYKNNHGVFQDVAVLFASQNVVNNEEIILKATSRLLEQIKSTYSISGVHLENSPGYHVAMSRLIDNVFKFNLKKNLYLDEIAIVMEKAKKQEYLLTDNNGLIAPFGDTAYPTKIKVNKEDNYYLNDQEAGYLIYKNEGFYLFIKSTGVLNTHSHDDDGSFIMGFENGLVISDVGFLDYTNSKERQLSKSQFSHNQLLTFDNEGKLFKAYCSIEQAEHSENHISVVSVCKDSRTLDYLYRRLYDYTPKNGLTIKQEINSNKVKRWEQPLQIDQSVGEINIIDYGAVLDVDDLDFFINTSINRLELIEGGEFYGYYAEPFGELVKKGILHLSGTEKIITINIDKQKHNLKDKMDQMHELTLIGSGKISFRKDSRPLQILLDLRIFIFAVYIIMFCFVLNFLYYVVSKFSNKLALIGLALGTICNLFFQLYIAYRIFLL